jgi:hypothetical protein
MKHHLSIPHFITVHIFELIQRLEQVDVPIIAELSQMG